MRQPDFPSACWQPERFRASWRRHLDGGDPPATAEDPPHLWRAQGLAIRLAELVEIDDQGRASRLLRSPAVGVCCKPQGSMRISHALGQNDGDGIRFTGHDGLTGKFVGTAAGRGSRPSHQRPTGVNTLKKLQLFSSDYMVRAFYIFILWHYIIS